MLSKRQKQGDKISIINYLVLSTLNFKIVIFIICIWDDGEHCKNERGEVTPPIILFKFVN